MIATKLRIRNKGKSLRRKYNYRKDCVSSVSFKEQQVQQEKKKENCPIYCGISQEKCLLVLYTLQYLLDYENLIGRYHPRSLINSIGRHVFFQLRH